MGPPFQRYVGGLLQNSLGSRVVSISLALTLIETLCSCIIENEWRHLLLAHSLGCFFGFMHRRPRTTLFLFNRMYATPTFEWTAFHFVTSRVARAATERSICEGKYQERSICEEKYWFAGYQLDCLCPSCCAWINMLLSSHSKCNIWYNMDNK